MNWILLVIIILLIISNLIIVIYFVRIHRKDLKNIERLKLEHCERMENQNKSFMKRFESMRVSVINSEMLRNRQWGESENRLKQVLVKTRTVIEYISDTFFNENDEIKNSLIIINNKIDEILKKSKDV